jgi:hypothetical protein
MHHPDRSRLLAFLLGLALLLPGCGKKIGGGGPVSRSSVVLGEINEILGDYVKSHGKAPAKLQDLAQFEQIYSTGFQALKSGQCVVVYNTKPDKSGNAVLAYEKDVPQKGGSVLMSNGTVKEMTPQEFEAAKKG